jgi:hypothetical protein
MENNSQNSPMNDNLISPARMAQKKVVDKIKVVENRDGLLERRDQKVITTDGREVLNEGNTKNVL